MRNRSLCRVMVLLTGLLWGCSTPPASSPGFRVVIIGADGMDPDLVQQWQQDLPQIRRLAEEGGLTDLQTVSPPQSAVAWASFITGQLPEQHGLFDSISRKPGQYRPAPGLGQVDPAGVWLGFQLQSPTVQPATASLPYWKILDDAGLATVTLRAPLSLPPQALHHGRSLAGLGVPDLRHTWGTHYYLASDLSSWDLLGSDWAGVQVKLDLEDGQTLVQLEGPLRDRESRSAIPLELRLNQDRSAVTIRLQGQEETVAESSWSGWFQFEFPTATWGSETGVSRFYVLETFPELRLYLMPVGPDPRDPAFPISSPGDYSGELAERFGLFKTTGASTENWGLNQERIDEPIFLEDLHREIDFWERVLLAELERGDASVYSLFLEAPDAASHMLLRLIDPDHPRYDTRDVERYGNALLQVYQRIDRLLGTVRERLEPRDLLLVVSDHGFHSWAKDFNTNAWLRENDFLRLKEPAPEPADSAGWETLFTESASMPAVDWGKTEAYSVGFAGIYLNLAGREPAGIVEPGDDYLSLVAEIRDKLLEYRDPDTSEHVVGTVRTREETQAVSRPGPDLILGLREGYRASWPTALGETAENILVANLKKWSGDHDSSDPAAAAGMILANRPLSVPDPALIDVIPTLYRLLGIPPPLPVNGKDLGLRAP